MADSGVSSAVTVGGGLTALQLAPYFDWAYQGFPLAAMPKDAGYMGAVAALGLLHLVYNIVMRDPRAKAMLVVAKGEELQAEGVVPVQPPPVVDPLAAAAKA